MALRFTKQQAGELARPARARFDDGMVAYLDRFFPDASRAMGEPAVRAAIDEGVRLAATYGIDAACDVCLFVDVMFTHGRAFAVEQPWARRILAEPAEPPVRALQLFRESMRQARAASRHRAWTSEAS